MNIYSEPSYHDLMAFTDGKFESMTYEQRVKARDEYVYLSDRRSRERSWEFRCPPAYRNTIPEQVPNLRKFKEVQDWKYGETGLLLVGPTRRGKTRAAWMLLKRLYLEEERSFEAFQPMDLKLKVATAWCDPGEADNWVWEIRHTDVLFLDDLDTIKFTETVEETIYDLFEFRPIHGKPVIVTVNVTGRKLAERMNASGRGAKIVERMRESCHVVNFT
jgi:DNA replication protein DnaC